MPTFRTLPNGRTNVQVRMSGFPAKSNTFDTLDQAKEWARLVEAQNIRARAHAATLQSLSGCPTFEEATKAYFKSSVHLLKRERTRQRELQLAVKPIAYLGSFAADNLTHQVIQRDFLDRRMKDQFRGRPVAPDTIRLEKSLISAVLNFCVFQEWMRFNPILRAKFTMPATKNRVTRISPEQEASIIDYCATYSYREDCDKPGPDYAAERLLHFVLFLFGTGMRAGEASRIQTSWIDAERKTIEIPAEFHKNKEARLVLITETLRPFVTRQLSLSELYDSKYLFFSVRDPSRPYPYYHPMKEVFRRAGLPGHVPHGIRHEFINRLFESDARFSTFEIKDLAGDKNVLSLQPYYHNSLTRLRDTMADHHVRQALQQMNAKSSK